MARTSSEIEAPRQLQEPKFWTKYSPHHELPLSAVTSFSAHVLALAAIGLILTGFLGNLLGAGNRSPVPLETIRIAGDDAGGGVGQNAKLPAAEVIPQDQSSTPALKITQSVAPSLQAPPTKAPPSNVQAGPPQFDAQEAAIATGKLQSLIGKFGPDTNSRSGSGPGSGPGQGEGKKPGTEARMSRWVMIFSTQSGQDYARQLADMGAILAVPKEGSQTEFIVYRDLRTIPARGQVEDITKIKRICWIDDKPESVRSLCDYLKIQPIPKQIAAFFPVELQDELRNKEKSAFSGDEKDIDMTYFTVQKDRSGKYAPAVKNVVRIGR